MQFGLISTQFLFSQASEQKNHISKMPLPSDYIDWLAKIKRDGGELAWIRGASDANANENRRTRAELNNIVLESLAVKVSLIFY